MRASHKRMKIETTDNNCILARLSREELASFSLTCEELICCDEKAQEAVKKILDRVRTETGNRLTPTNKLKIEILPDCSGGCLVMLLPLEEKDNEIFIFETERTDDLLDLILVLRKEKNLHAPSKLFEKDGTYRLTVPKEHKRLNRIMKEYLTPVFSDGTEEIRTEETFRCLFNGNALEILCGFFP